jgi:hypothetical protein
LTVAADVYSLGAILYELLTGRPPFKAETTYETLLQVMDQEPRRPRSLNLRLPADLETICLKCLQKEPGRRYGSAQALADDLEHWRAGRPIVARPVGPLRRILLWAKRRPAIAALLAAVVVVAAVGLGAFAWAFGQTLEARDEAISEKDRTALALAETEKARQQTSTALDKVREAEKEARDRANREAQAKQEAREAERQAQERYQHLRQSAFGSRLAEAANLAVLHPSRARKLLEDADAFPLDLRNFAWAYQLALVKHDPKRLAPPVRWHAFSADSQTLAWLSDAGAVTLWDVRTGTARATLAHPAGPITLAEFSRDGKHLLTAGARGATDRLAAELKTWDVVTGRELRTLDGPAGRPGAVAWGPGGRIAVAVRRPDGASDIWRWDAAGPGRLVGRHGFAVRALAFSPDGKRLASGGHAEKEWGTGSSSRAHLDFQLDNNPKAAPGSVIRLWDLGGTAVDRPLLELKAHRSPVAGLAFTTDGKGLLSWEVREGAHNHTSTPAFAPAVKFWELPAGRELLTVPFNNQHFVAHSNDGLSSGRQAADGRDRVRLWTAGGPAGRRRGLGSAAIPRRPPEGRHDPDLGWSGGRH